MGTGRGHGGNIKLPNAYVESSSPDAVTVPVRHTLPDAAPVTTRGLFRKRWSTRVGSAAVVLAALGLTACAAHGPAGVAPRVVWVSGVRAYVTSRDSTALTPGDSVTFEVRGKSVAAGTVSSVGQGEMATVAISSGSLAGTKDIGRVRVRVEQPQPRPVSLLRVGYPFARRGTLFFACGQVGFHPPGPEGAYRVVASTERAVRLARDPAVVLAAWPDTLEARLFDETADEEIALERGELDVAVFWPGELSGHMRASTRWQGAPTGTRSRGVVALAWRRQGVNDTIPPAYSEIPLFIALNRDLFHGDLMPLWDPQMLPGAPPSDAEALAGDDIGVDPSCPGRAQLEHYIIYTLRIPGGSRIAPEVSHLIYVSAPTVPADSARRAVAEILKRRPTDGWFPNAVDQRWVDPLFAIRCQVVCPPEQRRYVRLLGADVLVDLLDCRPATDKP